MCVQPLCCIFITLYVCYVFISLQYLSAVADECSRLYRCASRTQSRLVANWQLTDGGAAWAVVGEFTARLGRPFIALRRYLVPHSSRPAGPRARLLAQIATIIVVRWAMIANNEPIRRRPTDRPRRRSANKALPATRRTPRCCGCCCCAMLASLSLLLTSAVAQSKTADYCSVLSIMALFVTNVAWWRNGRASDIRSSGREFDPRPRRGCVTNSRASCSHPVASAPTVFVSG